MAFAPHFSEQELTFSQTATRLGIDNSIPDELRGNLEKLSWYLEEIRGKINSPIIVSSGFRCETLNDEIGGSHTSAHMKGLAADINVHGVSPLEFANFIAESMKGYDQIIHEYGRWVHVGLSDTPRGEKLTAMRENGHTVYKPGFLEV